MSKSHEVPSTQTKEAAEKLAAERLWQRLYWSPALSSAESLYGYPRMIANLNPNYEVTYERNTRRGVPRIVVSVRAPFSDSTAQKARLAMFYEDGILTAPYNASRTKLFIDHKFNPAAARKIERRLAAINGTI